MSTYQTTMVVVVSSRAIIALITSHFKPHRIPNPPTRALQCNSATATNSGKPRYHIKKRIC